MDVGQFDLNLLTIFEALLHERRVSAAATRLGLSQPAVSNALRRLRALTSDELFIRTANGMQPTPYAEALAEPVVTALAVVRDALNRGQRFSPNESTRNFVISLQDIGEIYFLPALIAHLGEVAPGVTISTVRNLARDLSDELAAGRVDLAIGHLPDLKTEMFQRRLFRQRYVCLYRRGHPLEASALTLSAYEAAEHVMVIAAGTGHGQVDRQLDNAGVKRRIKLRVPHFVAVGQILQSTDLIATVPEKLAERLRGPFKLTSSAHPVKLPAININMLWHARYHRDPANQWLRGVFVDLFAE